MHLVELLQLLAIQLILIYPITYIDYGPNSFLFTTGLRHRIIKMQNLTEEQLTHNTTFSHLNLGFPITKNWSKCGIIPFSDIGYEFENTIQSIIQLQYIMEMGD